MITIYHLDSSRSERIVWLMEELGLPYHLEVFERLPESAISGPGSAPADSFNRPSDEIGSHRKQRRLFLQLEAGKEKSKALTRGIVQVAWSQDRTQRVKAANS